MLGIDATYHIPGSAIKAAGYEWVGRYCLRGAYRIDKPEVADYLANGLGIEFFGEHQADFMLGGANAGRDAGADARDWLRHLGAPAGTAVFMTVDFEANPTQFPTLGAFMNAAAVELQEYRAGIYGSFTVVEGFWREYLTHQCEAWSYGRISDHANFFQRVGTTLPPIAGTQPGSYDENIGINPQGLWGGNAPVPPSTENGLEMIWCGPAYPNGSVAFLLAGSLICKTWTAKPEQTVNGIPIAAADWNNQPGRHFPLHLVEAEQIGKLLAQPINK